MTTLLNVIALILGWVALFTLGIVFLIISVLIMSAIFSEIRDRYKNRHNKK